MGRSPRHGRALDGILLLDKPLSISSNQALQKAKRLLGAKKAGHTGNLDVCASGLLPLCFGQATKVSQFLLDADKVYAADIAFGQTTTTGDAEGEVVSEASTADLSEAQLRDAMAQFLGPIWQVPPMYSALKHQGQPLYKLARAGVEVERKRRQVTISKFELTACELPRASVEIHCSKGTYVRTLAEDVGQALGCGAHVTALRRLRAGPFSLTQAYDFEALEALAETAGESALDGLLIAADQALSHLPAVTLSAPLAADLLCGRAIDDHWEQPPGLVRVYADELGFLGIGEVQVGGGLRARRLMRTDQLPAGA